MLPEDLKPSFPNHWVVKTCIYTSTHSQVYLVKDEHTHRTYTLKRFSAHESDSYDATLLEQLKHPRLPKIHYMGRTQTEHFIVKSYVEGDTLNAFVTNHGPLSVSHATKIIHQLLDILNDLHSQALPVIYRDIKPDNILINDQNQIYLIDLESARIHKPLNPSDTVKIASHGYTPPEQYGFSQTDARSDLFAVGQTLFFLLTGQAPLMDYSQKNIPPAFYALPKPIQKIICRSTDFDPNKRYKNAKAMQGALISTPRTPKHLIHLILIMGLISLLFFGSNRTLNPISSEQNTPVEPDVTFPLISEIIGTAVDASVVEDTHNHWVVNPRPFDITAIDDEALTPGTVVDMGSVLMGTTDFAHEIDIHFNLLDIYFLNADHYLESYWHEGNDFDSSRKFDLIHHETGERYVPLEWLEIDYFIEERPLYHLTVNAPTELPPGTYTYVLKNLATPYGFLHGVYTWELHVTKQPQPFIKTLSPENDDANEPLILPGFFSIQHIDDTLLEPGTLIDMGPITMRAGPMMMPLFFNQDLKSIFSNLNQVSGLPIVEWIHKDTNNLVPIRIVTTRDLVHKERPHDFIFLLRHESLLPGHYTCTFSNIPTDYGYLNGIYTWSVEVIPAY